MTNEKKELRDALEEQFGVGNVWNTDELIKDFEVIAFGAPFVEVHNRQTGKRGLMTFTHMPRFYYDHTELED